MVCSTEPSLIRAGCGATGTVDGANIGRAFCVAASGRVQPGKPDQM